MVIIGTLLQKLLMLNLICNMMSLLLQSLQDYFSINLQFTFENEFVFTFKRDQSFVKVPILTLSCRIPNVYLETFFRTPFQTTEMTCSVQKIAVRSDWFQN